jgi:hypothetical protein
MALVYFILGTMFYVFILPVVEQLTSLIVQIIEARKGKYNVDVIRYNAEAQEIAEGQEYTVSNAIGFEVPQYDEYYDEDEDDE